jgi:AraC-like DNA-binding protein
MNSTPTSSPPAQDFTDELSKIGPAFAKEGRASSAALESASPGEQMNDGNHANGAEPVRIWKARKFIELHSAEELSLGQVAQAANMSRNYFSEKFKEATGVTFVRYVARARFEKAAALLQQADLRVSEIAFAVGFQSLSQFNRIFKKFAGKAPREYRAAARHRNGNSNGSEP